MERRALRLANARPKEFWLGTSAWLVFFLYPLLPGALLRKIFGEIGNRVFSLRLVVLLVAMVGAEIAMLTMLRYGHSIYMKAFNASEAMARVNVLHAQLASGGPEKGRRAGSPGDAVARLRDDPRDLVMLVDNWVDVCGSLGYGVIALSILASIDPIATLAAIVPLLGLGAVNKIVGNHIRRLRSEARASTSDANDFLAAAFGAALTVKVSGAQGGVLRRIDELNDRRAKAMVRDQVWSDALWTGNGAAIDVCVGVALLVASRRTLEPADVSLFAAYIFNLVWLPQKLGGVIVGRRRFHVAATRLGQMLPDPVTVADTVEGPGVKVTDPLTSQRPVPFMGGPAAPGIVRPVRLPLQQLEIRGLTIRDRGVDHVDCVLPRGSLTVISGQVGSGKSSFVRGLIGLLPIDAGDVLWNGRPITDRAAFFIPPQCAYVPQVPHLFSETLLDNLLLGADADPGAALRLAAFDDDVKGFSDGLATRIGAGGVRLSGGQAQRAAAARALVHDCELILFDDLTSALDVETELTLWDRLARTNSTVLAVSNRPVARSRADQIIEL
jgi:ATP-binding cassette, subfamily B, bacterial